MCTVKPGPTSQNTSQERPGKHTVIVKKLEVGKAWEHILSDQKLDSQQKFCKSSIKVAQQSLGGG